MPNKNKESPEKPAFEDAGLGFVYKSLINRDPNKRRIKPVESVLCTTFGADLDDSESDDSDYKPTKLDDEGKDGEKRAKVNGKKRQRKKRKIQEEVDVTKKDDEEKEEAQNGPEGEDDISGSGSDSSSASSSSSSESDEESDEKDEEIGEDVGGLDSIDSTLDAVLQQANNFLEPSTSQEGTAPSSKVSDADLAASRSKKIVICAVCLGDVSQSDDEIVECDACGISVHELCYGITPDDAESIHSNASSASTEPWFCDPCKAGIKSPLCELCPNPGGIFKITDSGRWVHMVCVLYTHGVTFAEPEKLRGPVLAGLPQNRWGSKTCSLCEDSRFMQTGVCIECDAGMCRTFFHVTCAQREGLLLELRAHSDEEQVPDPYIAYCRLHSDREGARKKKRNYLSLQAKNRYLFKTQQQVANIEDGITNERTLSKLHMQRDKFLKSLREFECPPVPDPNIKPMARLLDASPRALRRLTARCELAGMHTRNPHFSIEDILDIRRKWHIQPAFSPEFITYYHDRNDRITAMAKQSHELNQENKRLKETEANVFAKYNEVLNTSEQLKLANDEIRTKIRKYLTILGSFVNYNGDDISKIKSFKLGQQIIALPEMQPPGKPGEGKEANGSANGSTTIKSGSKKKNGEGSSTKVFQLKECATCKKTKEQHMLALCDRCHLFYHLHCLDPPLRRMPKKTRSCGWQCSNCTEKDEEEQNEDGSLETTEPEAQNGTISNEDSSTPSEQQASSTTTTTSISRRRLRENPKTVSKYLEHEIHETPISRGRPRAIRPSSTGSNSSATSVTPTPPCSTGNSTNARRGRKRRTPSIPTQTNSNSPGSTAPTTNAIATTPVASSRKRKLSVSSPISFPQEPISVETLLESPLIESKDQTEPEVKVEAKSVANKQSSPNKKSPVIQCATCQKEVSSKQSVRCDNCQNSYHFVCLNPPCSKNPKRRGYTWCCYVCEKNENNKHSKSHVELEKAQTEKVEKQKIEEKQKSKLEKEKTEKVKVEKEKIKVEKEKTEKAKIEKEKTEKVKIEKEKTEKVKVEKEKTEKVKVEKEKTEKVRVEKEKTEKVKVEKEKTDKMKLEKDKIENIPIDKEKIEKRTAEKIEKEKVEKGEIENDTTPLPEKKQRKSSGEIKTRVSSPVKESKVCEGQSLLAKDKSETKMPIITTTIRSEIQETTSSPSIFPSPQPTSSSLLPSSPVLSIQQLKIPPTIEIPDVIFKSKNSPSANHHQDDEEIKDDEELEDEEYLTQLEADARELSRLLDAPLEENNDEEMLEEPNLRVKDNEVEIKSIVEFETKFDAENR